MWGDVFPICGDLCGDIGERMPGKQKPCSTNVEMLFFGRAKCAAFARLDQIQLFCPFDSRPATIDIEFVIDALRMCADSAQADHEFTRDLGSRQLGFEQSQNFKLTLAERLGQRLRSRSSEERRFTCARCARLSLNFKGGEQLACV